MLIATAAINVGTQGKTFVFKLAYNIDSSFSRRLFITGEHGFYCIFFYRSVPTIFALEMQKLYYVFLRNVEQIPKPLK